jgi:hypothetical protein
MVDCLTYEMEKTEYYSSDDSIVSINKDTDSLTVTKIDLNKIANLVISYGINSIYSLKHEDYNTCLNQCYKNTTYNMFNDTKNLICGIYYYRKNKYSNARKMLNYILGYVDGYELYYLGRMEMETLFKADKTHAYEYFVKGIERENMHCMIYLGFYELKMNENIVGFFQNNIYVLDFIFEKYNGEYSKYIEIKVYNDAMYMLEMVLSDKKYIEMLKENRYVLMEICTTQPNVQKMLSNKLIY